MMGQCEIFYARRMKKEARGPGFKTETANLILHNLLKKTLE